MRHQCQGKKAQYVEKETTIFYDASKIASQLRSLCSIEALLTISSCMTEPLDPSQTDPAFLLRAAGSVRRDKADDLLDWT
jgi:hypothetical protein